MTLTLTLPTKRIAAACLTGALLSLPVMAASAAPAPQKWTINPAKTRISFDVPYLDKFAVNGRFKDISGVIKYDERAPQKTTVRFTVQTKSIDTDLKARDFFLRRKELLNTDKHPTFRFVSKNIKLITPREGFVSGDFTALGITKPLTVKVTLTDVASRQPALKFVAKGRVNRLDYGSTAFPNLIGTIIPIEISGELIPDK